MPVTPFYLLKEDGFKIVLEDSSGDILLEPITSLDQFWWPSTFPDRIPPPRFQHMRMWEDFAATEVPKTIPVPDILHDHWFQSQFPDRIPPPTFRRDLPEPVDGALHNPTVLANLSWLPQFPDHPQPLPQIRRGMTHVNPSFVDLVTAAQMGWVGHFPDRPWTQRQIDRSPAVGYATFPPFIAASVTCWQLGLEAFTVTGFISDALTAPTLLGEGLARTDLIAETFCVISSGGSLKTVAPITRWIWPGWFQDDGWVQ